MRAENQDAVLDRSDAGLWAVADGMGGHAEGALASRSVVRGLATVADDPPGTPRDVLQACGQALGASHRQLLARAARAGGLRPPGSTVVALLLRDRHALCLWAGDSRAYRLRDEGLECLTRDHTVVQDMIDAGVLSPAAAAAHPARHALTRAVGAVDDLVLEQTRHPVRPGDLFLLCSDGVCGVLSDGALASVLRAGLASGDDDGARVRAIVEAVRRAVLDAGAPDNLSVVAILTGVSADGVAAS
nr:PP2C family serine/threonine-protein phosphatase [Roseospira visakhapatnamensis]